jgi:hypothetical protein
MGLIVTEESSREASGHTEIDNQNLSASMFVVGERQCKADRGRSGIYEFSLAMAQNFSSLSVPTQGRVSFWPPLFPKAFQ